MLIRRRPQRLSRERLSERAVVPTVPSDPAELSNMLSMVREQLLHPQTALQVYADTLFLNSLTREQLAAEKAAPLVHARRSLAVFEFGILALLCCLGFASEENRSVFLELDRERATWDNRYWELLRESGEDTHYPMGFLQPVDVKQPMPSIFPSLRK